ncbi:MAG: hypothetical protein RR790_02910 [Eubacterium sp.]
MLYSNANLPNPTPKNKFSEIIVKHFFHIYILPKEESDFTNVIRKTGIPVKKVEMQNLILFVIFAFAKTITVNDKITDIKAALDFKEKTK